MKVWLETTKRIGREFALLVFSAIVSAVAIEVYKEHTEILLDIFNSIWEILKELYKFPLFYILFAISFAVVTVLKLVRSSFEKRLCVGVATFNPLGRDARDYQKILIKCITEEIEVYPNDIKCIICPEIVKDSSEAQELGKKKRFNLLLWGTITALGGEISIEPKIQVIRPLGKTKLERQQASIWKAPIDSMKIDFLKRKAREINDIILFIFGLTRYDSGEYERAISVFKSINPQNEETMLYTGNSYYLSFPPQYNQAEKVYRDALKINTDYAEAHNNLGNLLYILNRDDEAQKEWEKGLKLRPDLPFQNQKISKEANMVTKLRMWFWFKKGLTLAREKQYFKAIIYFQKVIRIAQYSSNSWCHLGDCYRLNGEYNKAIECYKKVIESDPATDVWYLISSCKQKMIAEKSV